MKPMNPFIIADTAKSFEEACPDLQVTVAAQRFGVLPVHDLGDSLHSKGIDFAENCRVLEGCDPQQAGMLRSLSSDPEPMEVARQAESSTMAMIKAVAVPTPA